MNGINLGLSREGAPRPRVGEVSLGRGTSAMGAPPSTSGGDRSDPLQSQRPEGRDCCVRGGLSMKEAVVGSQCLIRTSKMSLVL